MPSGDHSSDRSAGATVRPAPGATGLLLVDVINPFDFEGSEALAKSALKAAEPIRRLRAEADRLGVPVVYVNDNFGHWGSEKSKLVELCASGSQTAETVISKLGPRNRDFFVIKPQVSGFYATNLQVLLPKLGVSRIVLTGFAGDICVLFTAADAHMRNYDLWVPSDAVASDATEKNAWALELMRRRMGAETAPTQELALPAWVARGGERPPG